MVPCGHHNGGSLLRVDLKSELKMRSECRDHDWCRSARHQGPYDMLICTLHCSWLRDEGRVQ